jgi:hypothetical protein
VKVHHRSLVAGSFFSSPGFGLAVYGKDDAVFENRVDKAASFSSWLEVKLPPGLQTDSASSADQSEDTTQADAYSLGLAM